MFALGRLLGLTLAGRESAEKIQLTADGTYLHWLAEGVLEVTPISIRNNGVNLLFSVGIHDNETASIELLEWLICKVIAGTLELATGVLFPSSSPEAIRRGEHYIEQDINHLFSGHHEEGNGNEAFRVAELERLIQVFFSKTERIHLHYDLHTVICGSKIEQFALYPWAEGCEHSHSELAHLRDTGTEVVLLQNKLGIAFSAYIYGQLGAEALTLELGKARPPGKSQKVNLERLERGLELLTDDSEERPNSSRLNGLRPLSVPREAIKHSDRFRLRLDDGVANSTELLPGYLLAGDIGGMRWVMDGVDVCIIFPNPRIKSSLCAGILMVPTGP